MEEKFKDITLRLECGHRGGGIEIDLTTLGYDGEKMSAYQNYLGGGMLGRIDNTCTIDFWEQDHKLNDIANELAEYFHSITNHEENEWECATFEENQRRPKSAY